MSATTTETVDPESGVTVLPATRSSVPVTVTVPPYPTSDLSRDAVRSVDGTLTVSAPVSALVALYAVEAVTAADSVPLAVGFTTAL